MVTSITNDNCFEFTGLSTDTKPTKNVGNGSTFFEMDTDKFFMFKVYKDDEGWKGEWIEIFK